MKLLEYGKIDAELCGMGNQDLSCIVILHIDVFKDLVRNKIINASLPYLSIKKVVLWCGESFQLLILFSCFMEKKVDYVWNITERLAFNN